jgi:2-keto-4-pentenoate hydratase/2-oxohepta-3-ene-1,7-dioic acid hydratase in catechol pathway
MIRFNNKHITPSKLVCIGKNYAAHIDEMGGLKPDDMTVFLKPNTALSQELIAARGEAVHFETEICLLIEGGRVRGVGIGFDLTKRDTQAKLKKQGLPWERSKAFDGSAVLSQFVSAPHSLDDLSLTLHVNGELRQQGHVSMMLYPPLVILEELIQFMSLRDGDVIMTGTPAGVGPLMLGADYTATLLNGHDVLVTQTWRAL